MPAARGYQAGADPADISTSSTGRDSMATITSTGIGSGIDIESIVTKLVAVEGQAQTRQLDTKQAALTAKLSSFGSFKSALDALKTTLQPLADLAKFQGRQVTVGDADFLAATATSIAAPGSYSVEVQSLARAQKLVSKPLGTATATIGIGTLALTAGGSTANIVIDASNNTLAGIRDAINGATDNPGITASIISASDGARLILSGTATGAINNFSITASGGDGGLAALTYSAPSGATVNFPTVIAAQNARVSIDGFSVESPTNTVSDALTGVSLNLVKQSVPGTPTSVTIAYDRSAARQAIDTFVKAYNNLIANSKTATAFDAKTKQSGALLGDPTLRDATASVRRELGKPNDANTTLRVLADIGITSSLDGTLKVDASKLGAALASGFDAVGRLFAGTAGIATRVSTLIDGYTKADGLIELRTKGLDTSAASITASRQKLSDRLATFEKRLRAQYNALDTTISQLKNTANYLTQLSTATNGSATKN
jgi:flagellar hook-associated protein 2